MRHLSSVHKVLAQTVPDTAKNDTVQEMELYLGTMIRQVDSSLIEEWERMRDPSYQAQVQKQEVRPPGAEEAAQDITRDTKAFTAAIRTRIFTFLRSAANADYEQALASLSSCEGAGGEIWTAERLRQAVEAYYVEHERICLDPNARNQRHTYVIPAEDRSHWRVQQVLVDPDEHNDWIAEFHVDLAQSRALKGPAIRLWRIGTIVR